MRHLLIAAAAATTMLAAPAFAQDTGGTYVEDETGFNGIYIGAAGGYDIQPNDRGSSLLFDRNLDGRFGDAVTTAAGANAFSPGFCKGAARGATPLPGGCRNDKNGFAYYGRVGLDNQTGRFVVGAVAEFGKSEINDSTSGFSTTPASYTLYRDIEWEGSVRGRLGYTPNDTTLFYGTFGAGYAKINTEFYSTNTANAYGITGEDTQWGILGGGGIEQKLGRNFSVGLEYMYHQYQDDDIRVRVSRGTQPATNPFVLAPNTTGTDIRRSDSKFRWSSIRATAAFRF
jgi:outer membrane immunogenic protein